MRAAAEVAMKVMKAVTEVEEARVGAAKEAAATAVAV